MIVGTGVDLAEVPRIRASIERFGARFVDRIYTAAEIAYVATQTHPVISLDAARSLLKLQDALEELDDVLNVFSNEEMDDALSEQAQGTL